MRGAVNFFAALSFMCFFGFSAYFNSITCFGVSCLKSKILTNVCLQEDEYFYPRKDKTFEIIFFYIWAFKTTFFLEKKLFITLYNERKIIIIPYETYVVNSKLHEISLCTDQFELKLEKL